MTPSERLQQPDMFRCERMPGRPTLSRSQCAERYRKSHDPKQLYNPTTAASFDNFKIPSLFHCWKCEIGKAAAGEFPEVAAKRYNTGYKRCKTCGQWKRLSSFHRDALGKQGRKGTCIACKKKRDKEREETKGMSGSNVAERLEQGLQEGKAIHAKVRSEKPCLECGTVKALTEFNRHNRTPDGRFNVCRECMAKKTTEGLRKKLEEERAGEEWKITIDFTDRREIYAVLSAGAEEDERDLPRQVLWLVKKTLQERGLLGGETG